jgi:hypothetical protein
VHRIEMSGDRGGAPPGSRTPNPLIIGWICSALLVVAQDPSICWAFAALWSFVAAARLLSLPEESRPVSRPSESTAWCPEAARFKFDKWWSGRIQLRRPRACSPAGAAV